MPQMVFFNILVLALVLFIKSGTRLTGLKDTNRADWQRNNRLSEVSFIGE